MIVGYFGYHIRTYKDKPMPVKFTVLDVDADYITEMMKICSEVFPLTIDLWRKSLSDLCMRFPDAYTRGDLPPRYPVPTWDSLDQDFVEYEHVKHFSFGDFSYV